MAEFVIADWIGISGIGSGIAGFLYALWIKVTAAKDKADIALNVVAQHGEEFNELRATVDRLREQHINDATELRAEVGMNTRILNGLHCNQGD